jgi:signal peptidase II
VDAEALPEHAAPRRLRTRPAVFGLLGAVALCVYVLDRIAKVAAVAALTPEVARPVLGNLLVFDLTENPGAAFSIASGSTWLFSIIAVVVIGFLVYFARRIRSLGWATLFGLLLGGTCGNLTDRLIRPPGFGVGKVVDFLQIPLLPAIFNLADVAIVSSMGLFVLLTLRGVGLDGRRSAQRSAQGEGEGEGPPADA